ncbi:DNA-binding response regulator, NarL/FixJ family, contains REC and HTH domains [Arachidicoccus rhizosphaerae]|jgi:DNA-binding NarL/FixJ family response regulator|uniref:DNA-binding response regulator, NarL/FixJ family, contains REC and HTH domains n=1 Tax=Arachidicoccus rhizosphaerae TaxID=551991 RepID=A0A1H4A3Z4_9BACT|nr:response regulator transcription factor [Arachidicoccus rhizosphaerae]SEA30749.1 DNA-binding response regulator, NarL/FixJ family, contains REC and HTH domains [Arachidicoccus rhizosphaerae]
MAIQDNRIKIAFVDDHPLITQGLKTLLERDDQLDIVGLFDNGASFLEFIVGHEVDVVLLDIGLPDINGMELCKQIKTENPGVVIILLSNHTERSIILQTMQNGANGYLLKNASLPKLKEAIFKAIAGQIVYSEEVSQILSQPSQKQLQGIPKLTKREMEILQFIAEGKTSGQIAAELYLSVLTVDTHRKNLMQKLEVKNAAELIRAAVQHQLLS